MSLDPSEYLLDADGLSLAPPSVVRDMDGDGRDELSWRRGDAIELTFGRTDLAGGLVADVRIAGRGMQLGGVAVADLDADGTRDLVVVANRSDPGAPGGIYVLPADRVRDAVDIDLEREPMWWRSDVPDPSGDDHHGIDPAVQAGGDLNGAARQLAFYEACRPDRSGRGSVAPSRAM